MASHLSHRSHCQHYLQPLMENFSLLSLNSLLFAKLHRNGYEKNLLMHAICFWLLLFSSHSKNEGAKIVCVTTVFYVFQLCSTTTTQLAIPPSSVSIIIHQQAVNIHRGIWKCLSESMMGVKMLCGVWIKRIYRKYLRGISCFYIRRE